MKASRRNFLKVAGISSFALLGGLKAVPAFGEVAPKGAKYQADDNAIKANRFAMVIDTRAFDSIDKITKITSACHQGHNVPNIPAPRDIKWIWTDTFEATFPDDATLILPKEIEDRKFFLLCNHCANPSCVRVCPTGATYKLDNGIVTMDYHRCIGCRFCMAACPYGSRSFNFMDAKPHVEVLNPAYPTRTRGAVEKCTFCVERLGKGLMPYCVEASEGAIVFGDLDDPASPVREALANNFTVRRKPNLGTDPSVFYII